MSRLVPIVLWIALPGIGACVVGEADRVANTDQDGDGIEIPDDCDDQNAAVYPGAPEVCDGIDNDCSGAIDDQPIDGVLLYADADGDGFGVEPIFLGCSGADGVLLLGDCNDGDPAIHPEAPDDNCDGVDDNCDGIADGESTLAGFLDADGDGYGDPAQPIETCDPSALAFNDDDCDDTNLRVNPSAEEICGNGVDNNCDGAFGDECGIDTATELVDVRGDVAAHVGVRLREGADGDVAVVRVFHPLVDGRDDLANHLFVDLAHRARELIASPPVLSSVRDIACKGSPGNALAPRCVRKVREAMG